MTAILRAGEALDALPETWRDATTPERRIIATSLLKQLRWSHDTQAITALTPLAEYLPSLAMILGAHGWEQHGVELICAASDTAVQPPVPGGKLSLAQQAAITRRFRAGESMVTLAREYDVFHATIWRIVKRPRRDLRQLLEEEADQ